MYGLGAAVNLLMHAVVFSVVLNEATFDFNTWWDAGVAFGFILSMVIQAPEVIMWLLSYLDIHLTAVFVFWSKVNYWYMRSAYWLSPMLWTIGLWKNGMGHLP
jgi:hypothetical protein